MSSTQRDQHSDIVFRGIDGNECEDFIAALEELAYAEGWMDDRRKMLFLARSRLRNGALRWFARLDPSVKNDWDLFVQALFDQYPPVTESSISRKVELATPIWSSTTFSPSLSTSTLPGRSSDTVEPLDCNARPDPSPSEANHCHDEAEASTIPSPLPYNFRRPGLHTGRLRIVYDDVGPQTYLRIGPDIGAFSGSLAYSLSTSACGSKATTRTTLSQRDALIVQFIPTDEPHGIGCIENRDTNCGALGLHVPRALDTHLQEYPPLVASSDNLAFEYLISSSYSELHSVSKVWNVIEDGTLQATFGHKYRDPKTGIKTLLDFTMTKILVDVESSPICFTKDYATPTAMHPISDRPMLRARIVFEPL